MEMQNNDWLEQTFARNRAIFGGWTMELEPEAEAVEVEGEENPPDTEAAEQVPPIEEEVPAEVLRTNLTKANQEAARYRTRLREVEKALEERKTDEQIEELLDGLRNERETVERSLLIENVALKHGLPTELAELLKGSTREELDAHALVLAKFAPANENEEVPPGDLDGGLNPGNESNDSDLSPRDRVRKVKGYR